MANQEYAKPGEFKPIDLLAVAAAREVNDQDVVFAGTGLPMLAIMVAQLTTAPNACCIYEAGSVDGRPISLPSSVGDARCIYQASIASGLSDVFGQLQRGVVDLAFLGGAEVDKYGNVNTTAMGKYGIVPEKRLTGSGGNSDINGLAKKTVFIMVQEKRRFKERVDYITSPGWRIPKWPSGEMVHKKEVYNNAYRGGPEAVITNMGVFRFDENGEMYLDTVHPGYTPEDVKENCSFDLNISRVSGETVPPTYKEIEILYNNIDPEGIFLP
ncbi:3-oxoadipate CoA-transferase subunit B [Candidatus Syntrophocurvum alkaliphilum]|uniref:3-oxoadipate CoA-transferase subunit B n=1 Tax=Candidatus Syntrophocurvum alkaliphilum TaxID=2293317 RepID=A0A6I6DDI0_9FIRM|nr:CoA-transferase [Candidatus Syntrophocurvum alkaliphilum]QGT98668.1 3-oxoadipate CoA-transferase subunit B [Candidatus Syntrophocurvum alkaliphilum]